ncbi:hypothetical protein [Niallia taxi]
MTTTGGKDGGEFEVYIDGPLEQTVNGWAPSEVEKQLLISLDLDNGKHNA